MSEQTLNKICLYLGGFVLFSILFLPAISFGSNFPTIQIVDFTLPFLLLLVILKKDVIYRNNYFVLIAFFALYILISITINGRLSHLQDLFEIYKLAKFLLLILFFSIIDYNLFFAKFLKPFFILLVVINALHFYNFFSINYLIEHYYDGGLNIEYFGLNSHYEPAAKRMVGLMGNPNVNSILFSFFVLYFLPLRYDSKKNIWFFSAILMLFMCQSRTSLFAFIIVFILIAVFKKTDWNLKQWTFILVSIAVLYVISWALATDFFKYPLYSNSMVDPAVLKSGSARGRFEVWQLLWQMIQEKPIFGYGAFKEYFYENNIYSENEYILMTWRYGFVGLILYLLLFLLPLKLFSKIKDSTLLTKLGLLIILFLLTGITNNPFVERSINVLLAIALAFGFNYLYNANKKVTKSLKE